jgi:hypothetical protein
VIFVTACDYKYYAYLKVQIRNIYYLFGTLPVVFDLGLRDYVKQLEYSRVRVRGVPKHIEPKGFYPSPYYPRALYKPYVIRDVIKEYGDKPILYMDSDARPIKKFDVSEHDIVAAKVNPQKLDKFRGTIMEPYVGPVHSGVIFLNNFKGRDEFVQNWIYDMENDDAPSDKKSFNSVLKDYNPYLMDEEVFNTRYPTEKTWILHSKLE